MLDRRRFLQMFGFGAAAALAEQAIPFNRVWSFPKQITIPKWNLPDDFELNEWLKDFAYIEGEFWRKDLEIAQTIKVKIPQRYLVSDA